MVGKVSREGRKQQIIEVLRKENRLVSSYSLAKSLQASPSWFWRNLFIEMMNEGTIKGCAVKLRNGKDAWFWGDVSLDCYTQTRLQGLE